jgi:hypothetical protein
MRSTAMGDAQFRAFGVGCAKTGTNSLARMFARGYRSAHEPQKHALLALILDRDAQFAAAVRKLLDPLDLEMNASQLNGYIVGTLVALYPEAKFVLTLREPAGWVRSFANHQLTRGRLAHGSLWARFRNLRFLGTDGPEGNALYTLDQYLRFWLSHNLNVLGVVPRERLLVVRTEHLDAEIPRLAEFLAIDAATIAPARANEGAYPAQSAPFDERELAEAAAQYAARFTQASGISF